ncbi:hypothetical protein SRHO_G00262770 [Serrasalmus rhombeus]
MRSGDASPAVRRAAIQRAEQAVTEQLPGVRNLRNLKRQLHDKTAKQKKRRKLSTHKEFPVLALFFGGALFLKAVGAHVSITGCMTSWI